MGMFSNSAKDNVMNDNLKKHLMQEISNFESHIKDSDNLEKDFKNFGKVVNDVFSKALNVHYKFTFEDLKLELSDKDLDEGVSSKIDSFCDTLSELEFDKEKITTDALHSASNNLRDLIDALSGKVNHNKAPAAESKEKEVMEPPKIPEVDKAPEKLDTDAQPDKKKGGIFSKLFGKKPKEELPQLPELPDLPDFTEDKKKPKAPEDMELEDETVKIDEKPDDRIKVKSPFESLEVDEFGKLKIPKPGKLSKSKSKKEKHVHLPSLPEVMDAPEPKTAKDEVEVPAPMMAGKKKGLELPDLPDFKDVPEPKTEKKPVAELKAPKPVTLKTSVKKKKTAPEKIEAAKPVKELKKTGPKLKLKKAAVELKQVVPIKQKLAAKRPEIKKQQLKLAKPVKEIKKPEIKVKAPTKLTKPTREIKKIEPKITVKKAGVKRPAAITKAKPAVKDIKKETKPKVAVKKPEIKKKVGIPEWHIKTELREKEKNINRSLSDILKEVEKGKRQVEATLEVLGKKEKIIKQEKQIIKKRTKIEPLPIFSEFEDDLDKQLKEISEQKQVLKEKDKQLVEKAKSLEVMEKKLKEWSKTLVNNEKEGEARIKLLASKEKVLGKIKDDLSKKYEKAMAEISGLKQQLNDKTVMFKKLQRYYTLRENRLAVEESNLLQEKRSYARVLSGLLMKHLTIANEDMVSVEKKLHETNKRIEQTDHRILKLDEEFKKLTRSKREMLKTVAEKKKYFEKVEAEFKSKDEEFARLNELLDKKQDQLIEKTHQLKRYENEVNESNEKSRTKKQSIELREFNLGGIEKQIQRLVYTLQNNTMRMQMREHQLEKRISSYKRLKKNIYQHINSEKRAVSVIRNRMRRKWNYVDKGMKLAEKDDLKTNKYKSSLKDLSKQFINMNLPGVPMETTTAMPSSPLILDILRLLNISKDFLVTNRKARARDAYLEIQRLFDQLDETEKEDVYGEILNVFKPKHNLNFLPEDKSGFHAESDEPENIDSLIIHFQSAIQSGNLEESERIYGLLQHKYSDLNQEEKGKYYPQIMQLYNKVLEHQVLTGAAT